MTPRPRWREGRVALLGAYTVVGWCEDGSTIGLRVEKMWGEDEGGNVLGGIGRML